jgi:hypothetical protein
MHMRTCGDYLRKVRRQHTLLRLLNWDFADVQPNVYADITEMSKFCKPIQYRKIRRFHGGDYEECRLLGCGAVQVV